MSQVTISTDAGTGSIAVPNPRTGLADFEFEPMIKGGIEQVADALRANQPRWNDLGLAGRTVVLLRWADAIDEAADTIGTAEADDTGRQRVSHEVPHIVANAIRTWAAKAPQVVEGAMMDGTSSVVPDVTYRTQLVPIPLLGVISPWNHPFLLSTLDAVPALFAGCAVIIKPSEISPRFIAPVMRTIAAVPELASVLRYVVGDGSTGQALIGTADAICFTGSVPTGRTVAAACAQRLIPAFLELGGNDPAVVTESADLDRATDAVLKGAVHNTGQVCFATERVYVQRAIFEPFITLLVAKASVLQPNYPEIGSGHIGPFIMQAQASVVDAHIDDALRKGASIMCGGKTYELGGGRYMDPTVLTGVTHDMKVMTDETFGPVIPVMAFETEDDAVALANDTVFGLSAAVIAGTAEEAERVAARINAGAISIQDTSLTPTIMGDVEKTSFGISGVGGSRMGPNGMLRFFRKKALIRRTGPATTMESLSETVWSENRFGATQ